MSTRVALSPVALFFTLVFTTGCHDPGTPDSLGPLGVQLLSPANGAVLPQDASVSGCGGDPGERLDFDWTDATDPSGIAGYEIYVEHVGAPSPLASTFMVQSRYSTVICGYVIDQNLTDWHWKVRARANSGEVGEWTDFRRFDFGPCRRADGGLCG